MADRIQMTATRQVSTGGASMQLRGGEFYLLPGEMAESLVEREDAYWEGEPPECDICGRVFSGVGAYQARERCRASHEDVSLDWVPGETEPPALDESHPEVAALREEKNQDLKQACHDVGVSEAEIVASGASGPVKDDYIRHLLRAKGRRGFYKSEDGS